MKTQRQIKSEIAKLKKRVSGILIYPNEYLARDLKIRIKMLEWVLDTETANAEETNK